MILFLLFDHLKKKDLYIKKTWYYNVIENLPSNVTITRGKSYKIVKKFGILMNFIEMYNKLYAYPESNTWSLKIKKK